MQQTLLVDRARGGEVCFKRAYLGRVALHLTLECGRPNWISSWVTLSRFSGADVGQGVRLPVS